MFAAFMIFDIILWRKVAPPGKDRIGYLPTMFPTHATEATRDVEVTIQVCVDESVVPVFPKIGTPSRGLDADPVPPVITVFIA
jgi:hypothetical protein